MVEPKTTYSGELRFPPFVFRKMPGRSLLRPGLILSRIETANRVSPAFRLAITFVMSRRPFRETARLSNLASLIVRFGPASAAAGTSDVPSSSGGEQGGCELSL